MSPIAWKSGNPFGIVAECDEGRLNSLCSAFIEGRLVLDDLLELNQIISEYDYLLYFITLKSVYEPLNVRYSTA